MWIWFGFMVCGAVFVAAAAFMIEVWLDSEYWWRTRIGVTGVFLASGLGASWALSQLA